MTLDEYLDWLERLVLDGVLTLAEAEVLAQQFDEFNGLILPLAPEDISGWNEALDAVVLSILAVSLYNVLRRVLQRNAVSTTLGRLTYAQRTAAFGAVQDSYQEEAARLARDLASGVLNTQQWHDAMNESLLSHYRSIAYLGYGTTALSSEQEVAFQRAVQVQQAYLSRFADQHALAVLRGEPWSYEYIANRSMMYSGAMRGAAFRAVERTSDFGEGWVFLYIAVDDSNTCSPCIDAAANGPYLAGQGPYPGDVCLGRHRCRCNRVPIRDDEAYQRLTR